MLTRKWLKHSRHENQSNDPDIIPAHRNGGVNKNNGQLRAISTNNAHLLDLLSGWFFEILCSPSKSTTGNPPREHDLLYFSWPSYADVRTCWYSDLAINKRDRVIVINVYGSHELLWVDVPKISCPAFSSEASGQSHNPRRVGLPWRGNIDPMYNRGGRDVVPKHLSTPSRRSPAARSAQAL